MYKLWASVTRCTPFSVVMQHIFEYGQILGLKLLKILLPLVSLMEKNMLEVNSSWFYSKMCLCVCSTCRPVLLPACSSTEQKQSCPGTPGLRHGCPGKSCPDLWPLVPQPSGSWWGKQSWWASALTFSLLTHLMPMPAWMDAGNTSNLLSQQTLPITTWVRE